MKEIKITPPEGYEVDKENSTFDCIKFKQVEKKNLTWQEIQDKNLGKTQFYINSYGSTVDIKLTDLYKHNKTHIPSKHIAEKVIALCQLHIIAEWYNDGWVADWNNREQKKYSILFNNNENRIVIYAISFVSDTNPIFKSEEALQAAYEANKEIFETALKP